MSKDSIIVISFEKYKEISKNPQLLEVLKSHKFYISDNPEEQLLLSMIVNDNGTNNYDTPNYREIDDLKKNHIIQIILESDLTEIEKKYYLYKLYEIYNPFQIKNVSDEITSKISLERIQESTNHFNQLSHEEKIQKAKEQEILHQEELKKIEEAHKKEKEKMEKRMQEEIYQRNLEKQKRELEEKKRHEIQMKIEEENRIRLEQEKKQQQEYFQK